MSRKVKRITVQLKPEHVALIKEALKRHGLEVRAFSEDEKKTRLRDEVLQALDGRAVL